MTAAEIGRRLLDDGVVAESGFIFRLPPWFGTIEVHVAVSGGVVERAVNRSASLFLSRRGLKAAEEREDRS